MARGGGPADFGPKGEKLLIQNYVSITDSRIHLQDLNSGETKLIAGGGEGGRGVPRRRSRYRGQGLLPGYR